MPRSAFALLALIMVLTAFLIQPALSAQDKTAAKAGDKSQADADKPSPELLELVKKLKSKSAAEQIKTLQELGSRGEAAKPVAKNICETADKATAPVQKAVMEALSKVRPDLHKHVVQLS